MRNRIINAALSWMGAFASLLGDCRQSLWRLASGSGFGGAGVLLFGGLLVLPLASAALTITSGPTFSPSASAPLAGVLRITTDVPSRLSVFVTDGTNTWQRDFLDYTNNHATILLGFKPARTHKITVTVRDKYRNAVTASSPVVFVTAALPSYFPKLVLLTNQPAKMEPGYTLFKAFNIGYPKYTIIVDSAGEVVWYAAVSIVQEVRQLPNGHLFYPLTTTFNEVDMLGQVVRTWVAPTAWPLNNHEGLVTDHGTILYLSDASRVVTNFPSSATISNAPPITTNVWYQTVVELSATNSSLLSVWSTIDMLDPRRISYLTFSQRTTRGWDWGHANAITEDPRDDSLIVSLRHQNAVIKFSRATGKLKWILGPPENWGLQFQPYLLKPVGTPFAWNYAQHAPEITPQGTLLMFDNGDFRASPFDAYVPDSSNYSRAVEYSINEDTMEVSQVWEYANTNETIYSGMVGNSDFLSTHGTVLSCFGIITYVNGSHPSPYSTNAAMIRIQEVTHEPLPEVVFDLAVFDYSNTSPTYLGCNGFRAHRIPDLYPVLPQSVSDLTVTSTDSEVLLEFSGDATRTYTVEASSDLSNWSEIGTAWPTGNGDFDFEDHVVGEIRARYYRVVTR